MAATRRKEKLPYIWVTWIRDILAGEAKCLYAPWFKARFKFDKAARDNEGSLAVWQSNHGVMVEALAEELRAAGHTITLEDQNSFALEGETAIVAGKPDVFDATTATVYDPKSGKRKAGDWWQVAIYLIALPHAWAERLNGRELKGEIRYRDGSIPIAASEITPEVRERVVRLVKRIGNDMQPDPEPSWRECRFCDLGKWDCPAKITGGKTAPTKVGGLF